MPDVRDMMDRVDAMQGGGGMMGGGKGGMMGGGSPYEGAIATLVERGMSPEEATALIDSHIEMALKEAFS